MQAAIATASARGLERGLLLAKTMQRILAALDESERAAGVLRAATDLAVRFEAHLVLFRAVEVPPEFPPAAATRTADELGPLLLAKARRQLDRMGERARSRGVATTVEVVRAVDGSRAILRAASRLEADMIVLGSHEHRFMDRLLGTNTARVAEGARCMVVVVHEVSPASRRVRSATRAMRREGPVRRRPKV